MIADTYSEFNPSEQTSEQRDVMLGLFLDARSTEPAHRKNIAEVIIVGALVENWSSRIEQEYIPASVRVDGEPPTLMGVGAHGLSDIRH